MKLDLDSLNLQQREAVEAKDGVYQIISVAGSGKTRVLTYRTAYLIGYHGVEPENILLTTFSKKAADEIKERMGKIINKRILEGITIGTFHSIGHRILRYEYKLLNDPMAIAFDPSQRQILGGSAQKWMIEEIMKSIGLDPQSKDKNALTVPEIIHAISTAKNDLIDADKFSVNAIEEKEFQIAEVYRLYEEKKREEKIIDFDDMLILLYNLFKEHPKILAKYQQKFKYILVDEAQDNNYAQYRLIEMLGKPQDNIFIVGDDDQSMYGFRGARPEEFVNFKNNYPNIKIINLEQNYRSLPCILETANKLIEKNTVRLPKRLIPFLKSTPNNDEVKYNFYDDEEKEAENIALKIEEIIKNKGAKYKDFAVIFRTNAQSRAIEDHFIRNMIPYVIYGGISFYERKEIKDIIAYMRLAINPHDDEAFERVVNTPSRYLGKAFMNTLKQNAKRRKCSLYESLKTANLTPSQHRNGMSYYNLINNLHAFVNEDGVTAEKLVQKIRELTKYDDYLRKEAKEEDNDVLENLNALETAASKHKSPKDFINFIKLLTKSKINGADAVQVMTIHKSKGLEFPYVFVTGVSENLLPHKYAIESGDPMAIEEERRLAYVAFTRAQLELHVSAIGIYNNRITEESRFLEDCELLPKEEENEDVNKK